MINVTSTVQRVLMVVIGSTVALSGCGDQASTPVTGPADFEVSDVGSFFNELDENQIKFDEEYGGKTIQITGKPNKIFEKDGSGVVVFGRVGITCIFPSPSDVASITTSSAVYPEPGAEEVSIVGLYRGQDHKVFASGTPIQMTLFRCRVAK